jgi:hypothetical protein
MHNRISSFIDTKHRRLKSIIDGSADIIVQPIRELDFGKMFRKKATILWLISARIISLFLFGVASLSIFFSTSGIITLLSLLVTFCLLFVYWKYILPIQGFVELAPSEAEILKIAAQHQDLVNSICSDTTHRLPTPEQPTNLFHPQSIEPIIDEELLFETMVSYMGSDVQFQITKHKLVIQGEIQGAAASIDLYREVYGVNVSKEDPKRFQIFTLIAHRERNKFEFECKDEEDCRKCVTWLNSLVWNVPKETSQLPVRRILILINPHSGGQSAYQQFRTHVKPLLDDVKQTITYSVVFTECAKHTTRYCQDLDITQWDVICCGGGDGTLNECLNGLMMRDDWEKATKIPLCPLPMGTTNAMAKSLFGASPSHDRLLISTFAIIRGFFKPIDVISVWQGGKRIYGLLNLSFGFLANVSLI